MCSRTIASSPWLRSVKQFTRKYSSLAVRVSVTWRNRVLLPSFPGFAGGKKTCIRRAIADAKREEGELSGKEAETAKQVALASSVATDMAESQRELAQALQGFAGASAQKEQRVASEMAESQLELAQALKSLAGATSKKEDLVCVELGAALKKVSATLTELFPESAWPHATAVRVLVAFATHVCRLLHPGKRISHNG